MQPWNDQRAARERAIEAVALEMKMTSGQILAVMRLYRENYEKLVELAERKARKQAKQAKANG